jgi:hypothetical protein
LADLDVVKGHLARDAAEFEFLECDMQSLHVVLPCVRFSAKAEPGDLGPRMRSGPPKDDDLLMAEHPSWTVSLRQAGVY